MRGLFRTGRTLDDASVSTELRKVIHPDFDQTAELEHPGGRPGSSIATNVPKRERLSSLGIPQRMEV